MESSRLCLDTVGLRREAELEVQSSPGQTQRVKGPNDQSQNKALWEGIASPGILEMESSC